MKGFAWVLVVVLLSGLAFAAEYEVVVVDNGEALVVASIEGSGLHTLPLPKDVQEVHVEGALYLVAEQTVQLSIGSTKKALVAYKTNLLTAKEQDTWNFNMELPPDSDIAVHLPKNTVIEKTDPIAFIENAQYKTISWQNQAAVAIEYSFATDAALPITGAAVQEVPAKKGSWWVIGVVALLALAAVVSLILGRKKPVQEEESATGVSVVQKPSEKETVLKTLSENELKVVSLLMENSGEMKRNILEKETSLAKSSLASTLYNLERKNIVKVNKTYAVHFVQLTEWFMGL